jgi:fermentation-respiration switch protein FrsA (DUF1100 family)
MASKAIYLIILILLLTGAFYLFYPRIENFFVFFPETPFESTPDEFTLTYRDAYFHTEDGEKLHGWFFPQKEEFPVILFCHGNAGNISHRLENIQLLLGQKLQVFIFDYRGYGKSSGRPSEDGLQVDGVAAYDYLTKSEHISASKIIPFGRSLGAAVAIEISLRRKVRSIIIEGAFTSTREMARTMPLFYPISFLLPAHYNNLKRIGHVTVPKLIIHATKDEIVPFPLGQKLFEAAKPPKFFYPVNHAGHNDTFTVRGEEYAETLAAFAYGSKI